MNGWTPRIYASLALSLILGCGDKEADSQPPKSDPAPQEVAKPTPRSVTDKVVILGFDGVDPEYVARWAAEGKLPNLKKLMDTGSFGPLTSTNPPQSPVAWASFATGANPGQHGIYDFVRRDPTTYLPDIGYGSVKAPKFSPVGVVTQPARGENIRNGVSFWKLAADSGVPAVTLSVPYTFPPEEATFVRSLSGLGTPDLRESNSIFTLFGTNITDEEVMKGTAGGKLVKLEGAGPTWTAQLEGPKAPQGRATTAVTFERLADNSAVTVGIGESKQTLKPMVWSDWYEFSFGVTPQYTVRGIGRFLVLSVEPLQVFMTPPMMHPDDPYINFSAPKAFSGELQDKVGFYKTVGWVEDTNALNSEKMPEGPWLEDVFAIEEKRAQMVEKVLDEGQPPLLIAVWTAPDRVGHMFARLMDPKHPRYDKGLAAQYGDALEKSYIQMDEIVGRVQAKLAPDTTLIIMSDHGFHSYKRGLNTNTWLLKEGYLVLNPGVDPGPGVSLIRPGAVDWSKTRAYALGTGQIYVNLAGREGKGIVNAGPEYDALVAEISTKLTAAKDGKVSPVSRVYLRADTYHGERVASAPDLQVAFVEGYRTSWETLLGEVPAQMWVNNDRKWSGDHAASDVTETAGILISNKKVLKAEPAIIDIGVTVLETFGVKVPPTFEGKNLWK